MDFHAAYQIINDNKVFSYSSLAYSEPDEILDYKIIRHDDHAIVLAGPYESYTKLHWAANNPEHIFDAIKLIEAPIYIEFIPEACINWFLENGFLIHSEFLGFFNMDLKKNFSSSEKIDTIQFLEYNDCGKASQLTMESKHHSRGFVGDSKEFFEEWIGTEHCKVIALKEDNEIIGLCSISFYDFDNKKGPALFIREMVVKPCYRGKGYGKRLMEQAIAYAVSKGVNRGFLHCDVENVNAIGLYNRYGFFSKPERGQINMIKY